MLKIFLNGCDYISFLFLKNNASLQAASSQATPRGRLRRTLLLDAHLPAGRGQGPHAGDSLRAEALLVGHLPEHTQVSSSSDSVGLASLVGPRDGEASSEAFRHAL